MKYQHPPSLDVQKYGDALIWLFAETAVELNCQIQRNSEVNYNTINHTSELLAMEARKERMSMGADVVLFNALREYSDRKLSNYDDVAMKTALLALELKSARNLPEERARDLVDICQALWRTTISECESYRNQAIGLVA